MQPKKTALFAIIITAFFFFGFQGIAFATQRAGSFCILYQCTPNLSVTYSFNETPVIDGNAYAFATSTSATGTYAWDTTRAGKVRSDIYFGTLHDAELVRSHAIDTSPYAGSDQFSHTGNYFLVIYTPTNLSFNRAWFEGDGGGPPPRWGIIHFQVIAGPRCTKYCYSNVAFIPGIQASRLYTDGYIWNNTLWEPNRNADVEKLYMTDQGESINNVFVGDPIDEIYGVGGNIYKSFENEMNGLVGNGVINDWKAFPYDWRYDVRDVVANPVKLKDGSYSMVGRIEALAKDSKTGKVTIVAHSNGGLVAEALVSALSKKGEANLIDKLIMVAVPEIGTPKAIAALLHGQGQQHGFGFVVSKAVARKAALNMPGAYGLLPFPEYFNVVDTIAQPIISFATHSQGAEVKSFESHYGLDGVTTPAEMYEFLLGADGRAQPSTDDTEHPANLNPTILSKEKATQHFLAAWTPPKNIRVIQVAGWGEDTIRGATYSEGVSCGSNLKCNGSEVRGFDYSPEMTIEGDGTVVYPSATAMNNKTYYVRLDEYNNLFHINRDHADILEISSVRDLIENIIENLSDNDGLHYITDSKPPVDPSEARYRLRVLSPVSLSATDSFGDYTGLLDNPDSGSDIQLVSEEIPNSYYMQFGEGKYLGFGSEATTTVKLQGLDDGTFTFEITEVLGDKEKETLSFKDIPTTPDMKATMKIKTFEKSPVLQIDMDGDGTTDVELDSNEGAVTPEAYLQLIKLSLKDLDLKKGLEKYLNAQIHKLEKELGKKDKNGPKDDKDHKVKKDHSKRGKKHKEGKKGSQANKTIKQIVKKLEKESPKKVAEEDSSLLIKEFQTLSELM